MGIIPWLERIPLKFTIVMVLVLAVAGEEYPFSDFPMYDSFEDRVSIIFVTGADGRPVATQKVFGQRASEIKKNFESHLRDEKLKMQKAGHKGVRLSNLPPERVEAAAAAALRWARDAAPDRAAVDQLGRIELHKVELFLRDGRVVSESKRIGRL
jgi:hypothetical protein